FRRCLVMDAATTAKGELSARHAHTGSSLVARPSTGWAHLTGSWPKHGSEPAAPLGRHLHPVRQFGKIMATSPIMHELFDPLHRFAPLELTIMRIGETGTGKDVLAQAIHQHSSRRAGPFVVFDCGAVAANLAESELLGHERGAFTGAVSGHAGAFERARGGTLFLDEVGELP